MKSASRLDLDLIVSLIPVGAKVLDLGCEDGKLLARLASERKALARGVEISETNVRACIARGLQVRQGNIEEGLADFRDGTFDFVVLSQTLAYLSKPAPVVREMLRVGQRAVISFDNAGYWRARWRALRGDGAGSSLASGEPRVRAITLAQFADFSASFDAQVEQRLFVSRRGRVSAWPELRADVAVYVIRSAQKQKT